MGYAYSFLDVACAIAGPGGAFPVAGDEAGNSDEGIKIDFAEDKGSMSIGADGTGMHNLHATKAGTLSISLLKNSPTNQLLTALYNYQTSSGSNYGQNIITLTNSVSGDIYVNKQCGFKKFPGNAWGKDGPVLVWEFNVIEIDPALGSGI